MTDPVADMLARINNALTRGREEVVVPHSKFKHSLAELLKRSGWLDGVEETKDAKGFRQLKLWLKYNESGLPRIHGLKRMSKPGQRIYAGSAEVPRVRFGAGTTIVSTSKGLMTDSEARKKKVGGEVICQIW